MNLLRPGILRRIPGRFVFVHDESHLILYGEEFLSRAGYPGLLRKVYHFFFASFAGCGREWWTNGFLCGNGLQGFNAAFILPEEGAWPPRIAVLGISGELMKP
ncbi:hypothetical protein [Akkermansia sp.]|uniref:hypothetical protein n=1 Tax=Akkermansia sp. TaxID=1872421 RepID=UPI003A94BF76